MILSVETVPAAAADELIAELDVEAAIFSWTSGSDDPWSRGFNIDGTVVFDCDAAGVVRNVDLLVPPELWEATCLPDPPVVRGRTTALRVKDEVVAAGSLHMPIRVSRLPGWVKVAFGEENGTTFLRLSDSATAQLDGGALVSLYGRC